MLHYYYYKLGESQLLHDPKAIGHTEQIKRAVENERNQLRQILALQQPSGRYVIDYL